MSYEDQAVPSSREQIQETKGHIHLSHPAGQRGVYWPVCQELLLFTIGKRTEKGIFAGTPPHVPGTPGHPGGFQKFYVFFSYVPSLLPTQWIWVNLLLGLIVLS